MSLLYYEAEIELYARFNVSFNVSSQENYEIKELIENGNENESEFCCMKYNNYTTLRSVFSRAHSIDQPFIVEDTDIDVHHLIKANINTLQFLFARPTSFFHIYIAWVKLTYKYPNPVPLSDLTQYD